MQLIHFSSRRSDLYTFCVKEGKNNNLKVQFWRACDFSLLLHGLGCENAFDYYTLVEWLLRGTHSLYRFLNSITYARFAVQSNNDNSFSDFFFMATAVDITLMNFQLTFPLSLNGILQLFSKKFIRYTRYLFRRIFFSRIYWCI